MLHQIVEGWWRWIVPLSWQLAIWIALIAGLVWLARRASPQVRYVLWTLVLVKVFLPPSLAVIWGFGQWGLKPIWQSMSQSAVSLETSVVNAAANNESQATRETSAAAATQSTASSHLRTVLFVIWLVGAVGLGVSTLWQYRRLVGRTRQMELIDEGPTRVALERAALQVGLQRVPDLLVSRDTASPFLFGLSSPQVVLPQALVERLSQRELDNVLLHELNHCRRGDLWVGAIQAVVQSLLWFHPLVWWANARLRQERECACDQGVLSQPDVNPSDYGQTLLSVLSVAKGRALYQPNLAGVFEPGANVQQRLEEIMKEQPRTHATALWYLAVASLLLVFLPMASVNSATSDTASATDESAKAMPAWIVETSPAIGATDVDPSISEITVTFDRDMSDGMSWTGQEYLPPTDPSRKAHWQDNRTCVLPVKLHQGEYYRIGLNAKSFQNFRSAHGQPAPCSVIYFVTEGATKAVQSRVRIPEIVKIIPENGADDIDPGTKALRVTFNVAMSGGMSWTGGGDNFPSPRPGERGKWSSDGRTCILPVSLRPDQEYVIGLNSLHHINFQSKWGVPLVPVEYRFKTSTTGK